MAGGDFRLAAAPGTAAIVMTRSFAAPRARVFEALTTPDLVRRWLLGPPGWSMPECAIDLRVGGRYRHLWRHDVDGTEMAVEGVFREIVAPVRIVATERFDPPWYPGEALDTTVLAEEGGRTTLTLTVLYESAAARDAVLRTPMEGGVAAGYDRLERLLGAGP
jgi:uncharacterized protein YndB with AHSA1/START domain